MMLLDGAGTGALEAGVVQGQNTGFPSQMSAVRIRSPAPVSPVSFAWPAGRATFWLGLAACRLRVKNTSAAEPVKFFLFQVPAGRIVGVSPLSSSNGGKNTWQDAGGSVRACGSLSFVSKPRSGLSTMTRRQDYLLTSNPGVHSFLQGN